MKENCKRRQSLTRSLRLFAILALLSPSPLFSQDDIFAPKDFSNTNIVTISLGEDHGARAMGENGLRHFAGAGGDARSTSMSVQGMLCRCLDPAVERFPKAYLPFSIDPTFKGEEKSHVRVDVEY